MHNVYICFVFFQINFFLSIALYLARSQFILIGPINGHFVYVVSMSLI